MPFLGSPTPARAWMVGPVGRSWESGSDAIAKTLKRMRTARRLNPGRRLKMPFEELELRTQDGVRLQAWFVPGAQEAPDRSGLMAVIHHHYGGQRATVLPWIHLMHRLGIPSLAFDARGHGASEAAPPGRGSFVVRALDVEAACAELRARGARRLLGLGQSQGAAALVMGVAGRADLAGCILDSGPAPDMMTAAWGLSGNMLGSLSRREPWTRAMLSARIVPGTQPVRYVGALWRNLARLRSSPLLWLHGGRDEVIARRWSALWFRTLRDRSGTWRHVHIPEADHVRCLQEGGERVESAVRDFVSALECSG